MARDIRITNAERAQFVDDLEVLAERYSTAFDARVDASVQTPIDGSGWGRAVSGPPSRPSFAIEGDGRVAFVGVGGERLGYIDAPLETFASSAVPIDQLRPEFANRTPEGYVDLGLHVRPDGELMIERVDVECGIPEGAITVGFRPQRIDAPSGLELSTARESTADPFDPDIQALAITPIGWLPDRRAAVMIDVRFCGGIGPVADDRNGIYLLDEDGEFELVVSVTGRRIWLLDPT